MSKIQLNIKWVNDFNKHITNVIKYFSNKKKKLLIFNIEKDNVKKINDFFPEYKLDPKLYIIKGKTKNKKIY